MITLRNVTVRRGPNLLLESINWTIYPKNHFGLIGANGSGKSTLFSLLLGEFGPDKGDVDIAKNFRMSHVAQETPGLFISALDFVLDGDEELRSLQSKLLQAEHDNDGHLIAELHHELEKIDAYTADARAAKLLSGLGFPTPDHNKIVSSFSGGWRVRLNLAKALMCRSDILLLDEPTNHLDLDAIVWLEQWLLKYDGTLIIVSHDRDFLDKVVDQIAHISNKQLTTYTGNYSSFEQQLATNIMLQQAAFEKQQKKIAHLQSFVNRFKAKASKAKQAQSRMKAIEKMELVSITHSSDSFEIHFLPSPPAPNPIITLNEVEFGYDDRVILRDINFSITPKDRIALLGQNGAGKSTLIKLLVGEIKPQHGVRTMASGVRIGYFAQHQVDMLNLLETPLFHIKEIAPDTREVELRAFLGGYGFAGDRVHENIKNFSGGEKSRLALALLIWQKPNLILLDEPTNHLDLEMREALSMALQEYEGAMILVSHDRFLVRATADQLFLIADEKMTSFDGDLDDYQRWLSKSRSAASKPQISSSTVSKKEQRQIDAKLREEKRPLQQQLKKHENEISSIKAKLAALEIILANPEMYEESHKQKLQEKVAEQTALRKTLENSENLWIETQEKLDKFSSTD